MVVITEIQKFYSGASIFLTGGTGFLGKIAIEKLLRTCPDLKMIYILVRPKKGKETRQRFEETFESVLFDHMKSTNPNYASQVSLISGDSNLPNLGLSDEDRQKLIDEVTCVFNCAATVRFDQKLRTATYINVRATRDLLLTAKEMKQLKAFVHVSTAFSFCPQEEIDEVFYDSNVITGKNLMQVVDALDDNTLNAITPTMIGEWPNTYTYTKAVAEEVLKTEGRGLPLALIRPSIVMGADKEPLPGWIDNFYGATGILAGGALGLIRTLHCDPNKLADMIPADYVINCMLAAAWNAHQNRNGEENEIVIYNSVSSPEKPITWREVYRLTEIYGTRIPSVLVVWYICFTMNPNWYMHMLYTFFLHQVPAYIIDFIAVCIGKKPMLVDGYKKINKFTEVIGYFSTKEWHFHNNNTQKLWLKLSEEDKRLFHFDMASLIWDDYFCQGTKGGRVYLLKDPMETVPEGKKKFRRLQILHYTLISVCCCLLFLLFRFFFRVIFN